MAGNTVSAIWPYLGRILLVGLLAYIGVCFYIFLRQRTMLYHPNVLSEAQMLVAAQAQGLLRWSDSSGRPLGWVNAAGAAGEVVLILHGNTGHALDREKLIAQLRAAGVASKIFLVDYPGYGSAKGNPNQTSLTSAAAAALNALQGPVILVGESLGTGVAAQVAARYPEKIRGLILITPFDSMTAVAAHHHPWLPIRALLLDRFDSIKALKGFTKPTAIVIGEEDSMTPPAGGKSLYQSLRGPKRLWAVPGADHNEVTSALPLSDWRELWKFISSTQR